VTCKAGNTKNRKLARLYLTRDVADPLAAHVATKAPGAPVFAMPHVGNAARMFKADMEAARRAWLEAAQGPEERLQREQSDFLAVVNHDGEHADFHCLRHTCGAWLAMAGNHPKTVQSIMRHASITMTMDTYGHLFPGQEADAIAKLPKMMENEPELSAATGTDSYLPADRQQSGGQTWHGVASLGNSEPTPDRETDRPKLFPLNTSGENWQGLANADESGSKRTKIDPLSDVPRAPPYRPRPAEGPGRNYSSVFHRSSLGPERKSRRCATDARTTESPVPRVADPAIVWPQRRTVV
jgi:hypothetical protein